MLNLKQIEHDLRQRRAEMLARANQLEANIRRTEGALPADFAEQATARENDDVADALDTSARNDLAAIDRALARIAAGTYGKCTQCGKVIAEARLQAIADASTCVECARG